MSRFLLFVCLVAVLLTTVDGCGSKVDPTQPTAAAKPRRAPGLDKDK